MEVYGDSVSAGEVSEAEFACGQVDPEGHNGRYSNGYLSYSWQTARLLGAELHDIATGGMALLISEESKVIDKLDGLLTLKGLRMIYERNKAEGRIGK